MNKTEKKKILNLYTGLGIALLSSIIPSLIAGFISFAIFTGILIAAYVVRSGAEEDSFTKNHASFIIRTTWIGSLYMLLTMIIGSIYMLSSIDNAPLNACTDALLSATDVSTMMNIMQPCLDRYIEVNMQAFIISGIIVAGPILLFFVVRFIKGLKAAMNNQSVSNLKSWF